MKQIQRLAAAVLTAVAVTGCSSVQTQPSTAANGDFYEVYQDGRVYMFYDDEGYRNFLAHGHTPYAKTRISAGPNGETLVFSLTSADKAKQNGIPSIDMYDGTLEPAADFYGEMVKDGRIYVFSRWEDMEFVRSTGEAPLRYTDIGGGPNGMTVVYVLNEDNKRDRPDALIAMFKARHGI